VLNQVSEDRAEWLVPGMLKDKLQALLKSLPQRPRSRFVPLPESAQRLADLFTTPERWAQGSLIDALLKQVRDETSLDVKRADFKLDMLSQHLFMNFRITDEHGRQLGQGRNLGALKAELGAKARGAFQALAALQVASVTEAQAPAADTPAPAPVPEKGRKAVPAAKAHGADQATPPARNAKPAQPADSRYREWSFGELPELMEIGRGGQTLIGFPALIDHGDAVGIEVFDEPEVAAARHRVGLRRLFALQIRDALKYLEKNIPDLQKMAVAYMPQDGRGRLTLIANEVARMASTILVEYAAAQRKIKDTKNAPDATADAAQQLQRLVPRNFIAAAPWTQLQHYARYLKAITSRLDKYRADPARDAARLAELRPLEQRYWRLVAERKGHVDARMQEYRWMLEELRVSFFAQELRTPYPVSIKRLDKVWQQLQN
jgi:ATP-dependent helicase HrpA